MALPAPTAVILPLLTVATRVLLLLQVTLVPDGAPEAESVLLSPANILILDSLMDRL